MENTKIAKIKKSASVTATVIKVVRVIASVAAIICLVCGIICIIAKNHAEGTVLYDNGNVRVLLPIAEGDYVEGNGFEFINKLNIDNPAVWGGLNCIAAAALLAAFAVFLLIVGKVFEELKSSDTPFTESIQKKLKITAILVTLMVATESLGMAAIVALGFWCVYSVFGYGIELQKNEDETL